MTQARAKPRTPDTRRGSFACRPLLAVLLRLEISDLLHLRRGALSRWNFIQFGQAGLFGWIKHRGVLLSWGKSTAALPAVSVPNGSGRG